MLIKKIEVMKKGSENKVTYQRPKMGEKHLTDAIDWNFLGKNACGVKVPYAHMSDN